MVYNYSIVGRAASRPARRPSTLRWTPELHQRFLHAIDLLGGPRGATPKQIQATMNVEHVEVNHVKSHLQKYRLTLAASSGGAAEGRLQGGGRPSEDDTRGEVADPSFKSELPPALPPATLSEFESAPPVGSGEESRRRELTPGEAPQGASARQSHHSNPPNPDFPGECSDALKLLATLAGRDTNGGAGAAAAHGSAPLPAPVAPLPPAPAPGVPGIVDLNAAVESLDGMLGMLRQQAAMHTQMAAAAEDTSRRLRQFRDSLVASAGAPQGAGHAHANNKEAETLAALQVLIAGMQAAPPGRLGEGALR